MREWQGETAQEFSSSLEQDAYRKVHGMRAAKKAMIDGLKDDRVRRFAGREIAIRAAYSGDAQAGALWQEELQTAFPDIAIGWNPLPIGICCHTGDGTLGVSIMKDILTKEENERT